MSEEVIPFRCPSCDGPQFRTAQKIRGFPVTHRKWSKAVTIALESPDVWVVIDTTQAASWALIEDWPLEEAPALDRALSVCADVITGKRTPEDARRAFIDAVNEAHIPMKEG